MSDAELMAIVELIYDAAVAPERWQAVLDALGRTFDATGLMYVFDARAGATPLALSFGMDQASLDAYVAHYAALNPYPQAAIALPVDRTIFAHDVVAPDEVAKGEFYNDFLRQMGVSLSHLSVKPIHDQERLAILALSPNRQVFEASLDETHARFEMLRPHITRALKLNVRLAAGTPVGRALEHRMAAAGIAVLLLDVQRRPLTVNGVAQAMLKSGTVLTVDRFGAIVATDVAAQPRLEALVGRAGRAGIEACRLRASGSAAPFLAWTVPLAGAMTGGAAAAPGSRDIGETLAPRGHALLMVRPLVGDLAVAPEVIAAACGLTPAEARLVAALVKGSSIGDYADVAGLSERTARNQLTAVFEKTGTSRQHELVAHVMARIAALI